MAAKKEEKTVAEETVGAPEGERKVTIKLPKSKENAGPVFVSVNERTFLIQRGVAVDVPKCVAEAIATSERYADEATEYELAAQRH